MFGLNRKKTPTPTPTPTPTLFSPELYTPTTNGIEVLEAQMRANAAMLDEYKQAKEGLFKRDRGWSSDLESVLQEPDRPGFTGPSILKNQPK